MDSEEKDLSIQVNDLLAVKDFEGAIRLLAEKLAEALERIDRIARRSEGVVTRNSA